MKKKNRSKNTSNPEIDGKVPVFGVMSETYKEEVSPKDLLGNTTAAPEYPEESDRSREGDINSEPLEKANISGKKNIESDPGVRRNKNEQGIDPSATNDDEF